MEKGKLKKVTGIAVDVLMFVILLVQMLYVFTGNTLHEILGIGFFVCLVVHIIFKRNWYKTIFNNTKKHVPRKILNI